jgi:hypothetical protein
MSSVRSSGRDSGRVRERDDVAKIPYSGRELDGPLESEAETRTRRCAEPSCHSAATTMRSS